MLYCCCAAAVSLHRCTLHRRVPASLYPCTELPYGAPHASHPSKQQPRWNGLLGSSILWLNTCHVTAQPARLPAPTRATLPRPGPCSNLGTFITLAVVVNVQTSVSWPAGFLIIAGAFVVATSVFVLGQLLGKYK